MPSIVAPTVINIPPHGEVTVLPRRDMKRIILRMDSTGKPRASVPAGISTATLISHLRRMLPRLAASLSSRPAHPALYTPGWSYSYPEGNITATVSPDVRRITVRPDGMDLHIILPPTADTTDPLTASAISATLLRAARHLSQYTVLPQAKAIATELGAAPDRWEIGLGRGTLGCCYKTKRLIRLSAALLFLPTHLRRFVVCHELAHLTHPDHSPEFHNLCNSYCLGLEKQLVAELKKHIWPFVR